MLVRILVCVAASEDRARALGALAGNPALLVSELSSGENVWERLAAEPFDLLVLDRESLPDELAQAVAAIRALPDQPDVIVAGSHHDPRDQGEVLAAGALAVVDLSLGKRAVRAELTAVIERVREDRLARLEVSRGDRRGQLHDLASSSPAMRRLMELAARVAQTDTSVLLLGETGVGKEWLARAIHRDGVRRSGPFLAVNCGAIPETLLESELFGHEEGAFTGASRAHRGHFELAHGGTLFLDEVAEMPPHVQVRLLRVLQERRIKRVGGEREIDVDVRIMAATNRDLDVEIREGRFRPDLYYRLGVMTLTVPPLRERREDIPALVHEHVERFRAQLGASVEAVAPAAMRVLLRHDWPGNVRELINAVERAVLLCPGAEIGPEELSHMGEPPRDPSPDGDRGAAEVEPASGEAAAGGRYGERLFEAPLAEAGQRLLADFEREYLVRSLRSTAGRVGAAARRAGISERTLFEKMRRYGLRKEDYRP